MSPLFFAAVVLTLASDTAASELGKSVTPFAESLFGTWARKQDEPAKAILGPVAYRFLPSMKVLRDPATNDVWFTLLQGQMWHVIGNETQYCFGPASTKTLAEQTPFSVDSITETSVSFCWRRGLRGMPTQAKGCFGCDCARILLNLTDSKTLRFQFWMSPPVLHADVVFVRSDGKPTFKSAIESTMTDPYKQCSLRDHYGPNVPGEPSLTTQPPSARWQTSEQLAGGCAQAIGEATAMHMRSDDSMLQTDGPSCYQLNGANLYLDNLPLTPKVGVPDVKIQFTMPSPPCDPCDVSYAVSAKIQEDEYIGVGFKGRSWERDFPYAPERPLRPCYFGMCIDPFDSNTSDRIALGYTAGGGCFREMIAKNIVGAPSDVKSKVLKGTSVDRASGRTILRFTVSQHFQFDNSSNVDGPFRIMWAIGKVTPSTGQDACAAGIGYHDNHRGVAPLQWLKTIGGSAIGSTPCKFDGSETNDAFTTIV